MKFSFAGFLLSATMAISNFPVGHSSNLVLPQEGGRKNKAGDNHEQGGGRRRRGLYMLRSKEKESEQLSENNEGEVRKEFQELRQLVGDECDPNDPNDPNDPPCDHSEPLPPDNPDPLPHPESAKCSNYPELCHYRGPLVRHLKDNNKTEENISQSCKNDEEYLLSLFVSGHIYLFVTPVGGGSSAPDDHDTTDDASLLEPECPSLVFHDPFDETGEIAQLVVDNSEEWKKDGLHVSTLKLAEVLEAIDLVALNKKNKDAMPYDIVHNNCASFALEVADILGIEVDEKMTSYASKQLYESGASNGKLIELLRSSPNLLHLSENAHELEDKVLVELMVKNYVEEHKQMK